MPISVNWLSKVIMIPQSYLTDLGAMEYELDVNQLRLDLKDIEDDDGMPFLDTHRHNTEVVLGNITLARVVEIINGYMIEFEDGQYSVNLTGANNNIIDVKVLNQVSIRSQNSAGLIAVEGVDQTTLQRVLDILEADEQRTSDKYRRYHKDTKAVLVEKDVVPTQPAFSDLDLVEPP